MRVIPSRIKVINASEGDYEAVVTGLDNILSKEGFGFINKLQIKTELKRGSVFLAFVDDVLAGYRVGKNRLWNIAVHSEFRGMGVGKALLLYHRPSIIRVKNNPIGHLSKAQKDAFVDPTPFYESMGYKKMTEDYGRNFWQRGKATANFHKTGSVKHISVYIDEDAFLFTASEMGKQ